jgi:hypothetical protein
MSSPKLSPIIKHIERKNTSIAPTTKPKQEGPSPEEEKANAQAALRERIKANEEARKNAPRDPEREHFKKIFAANPALDDFHKSGIAWHWTHAHPGEHAKAIDAIGLVEIYEAASPEQQQKLREHPGISRI